jgi:hypothetical protein
MSILGDQVAEDLGAPFDDWADPVTFTAPTGAPPVVISTRAIVNRTSMATDLMSGEKVAMKRSSLTCLLAELTTMPGDGWSVAGSDLAGAFTLYVKGDPMPDQTLGIVTIMLME